MGAPARALSSTGTGIRLSRAPSSPRRIEARCSSVRVLWAIYRQKCSPGLFFSRE